MPVDTTTPLSENHDGLLLMVVLSLFPAGVLQLADVLEHGYWHARSLAYTGGSLARLLEWCRLPGDLVFIVFGVVPIAVAALGACVMRSDSEGLPSHEY